LLSNFVVLRLITTIIKSRSHKYIKKITDKNGKTRYIYEQKVANQATQQQSTNSRYVDGRLQEVRRWMAATNNGRALGGERFKTVYEFFNRRTSERVRAQAEGKADEYIIDCQREEQRSVIEFAKQNNLWYSHSDVERLIDGCECVGLGQESVVLLLRDKTTVLKQMTGRNFDHLNYPMEAVVRNIAMYNELFPNSYLHLEGISTIDRGEGEQVCLLVTL